MEPVTTHRRLPQLSTEARAQLGYGASQSRPCRKIGHPVIVCGVEISSTFLVGTDSNITCKYPVPPFKLLSALTVKPPLKMYNCVLVLHHLLKSPRGLAIKTDNIVQSERRSLQNNRSASLSKRTCQSIRKTLANFCEVVMKISGSNFKMKNPTKKVHRKSRTHIQ